MARLAALLRLEILRQRRQPLALVSLLLLGLVGTPLGAAQALHRGETMDLETDLMGDLHTPPRVDADATFAAWVQDDDELVLSTGPLDVDGELTADEVVAEVSVDPERHEILVKTGPTSPKVNDTVRLVRRIRDRHDRQTRRAEAQRLGVDLDTLQPSVVVEAHQRENSALSPWVLYGLPWLLTMLITTGTLYGSFDVLLSERLHRTAETLLTSAATRRDLVLAKGIVVSALGLLIAIAALVGLGVATSLGAFPTLDPTPGIGLALGAAAASAVISMQLAAAFLGVATFCEDHKSAGLVAGPMLLAPPILASIAAFPGPSLNLWSAWVPITNVLLVYRDALLGTLTVPGAVGVALAVTVQAGLGWRFAARRMSDPDIVTGVATAEGRRAIGRFGPDAFTTYAVALALFWFVGIILQQLHLEMGLVLAQGSFVAVGLGAAAFFGMDRARLRLSPPRASDLSIGVLLGLCTPALAAAAMWAQELVLPGGQVFAQRFGTALMDTDRPLWLAVLLFAALPGACEELLFRSSLLGMLERDARPWPRVLLVALLFALLHLSVYRLLVTFMLGVVLGWVTLRTRSIWPAVALHITHNAALVFASSMLPEVSPPWVAGSVLLVSALGFTGTALSLSRQADADDGCPLRRQRSAPSCKLQAPTPPSPPRSAPAADSADRSTPAPEQPPAS